MKIAYVSTYDTTNRGIFNAIGHYEAQCLRDQGMDVVNFGPLRETHPFLYRVRQAWYKGLFNKRHSRNREPGMLRGYARQIEEKLQGGNYDLVFSTVSPASQPIAYLECSQPIVIWTDATFSGALDFYPEFSSRYLTASTIRNGIANERSALNRVSLALYFSDWAARTAVANYDIDPNKVKVVAPGPCMDCDRTAADAAAFVEARKFDCCRLLFVGSDWRRKGADLAVRVAERLTRAGVKTELNLVGCNPPDDVVLPDYVKVHGFIPKATPEGGRKMFELFSQSHFLIVPSIAECYGLVFAEASSFALPSLSRAVGGIPTVIRNGANGWAFERDANPDEYVNYIAELMSHPEAYRTLSLSAFNEYETRLNWDVAGQTIAGLLQGLNQATPRYLPAIGREKVA